MVITKLKGGLGNQMFQYATGRFLSLKNNNKLFLELSHYDKKNINPDYPREYSLHYFKINSNTPINSNSFLKIALKIYNRLLKKTVRNYYLDYHPELLEKLSLKLERKPKSKVILDGFFQSEKNFSEIRPTLLQEFQLKPEFITDKVKEFQDKIEKGNSVSIHIRRGDYVSNPDANAHHGLCPLSYYRDAIDLMVNAVENPHFFIYTDDVEWVKENLEISDPHTFVSGNGLTGPQELWLMSKCNHNIIANSSFSWWGAWLNQNPGKNVIAPKQWTIKGDDHPNIIAEGWVTL